VGRARLPHVSAPSSPADPEFVGNVLTLFEAIHPLDRVPRAGYVLRGVTEPESVSAHSHFLAVLVLLFCERYPADYDRGRALAMALVHDLPEARLMDIPMPYADAYLSDAKHRAEQAIADDLLGPLPGSLAQLHQEFTDAATPEARLLRGLDKAQMMIKVLCYDREHRGRLEEFWINPKNFNDFGIPAVSALFDAICEHAGRERPRA
jgi:putative hydrolase of HD superfamily